MKTHKKLTSAERILLAAWKKEGLSNIICAKRLRRAVSTIGRELKRNRIRVSIGNKTQDYIYEPNHAQFVSESKKQNAWLAKQPLKNKKIYAYVLEKLKESWSPEQIAGRLRKIDHPDDPSWHICMETIYQFIYKEKSDKTKLGIKQESILNKKLKGRERQIVTVTDNEKPLYEYLRRKQKRRRKLSPVPYERPYQAVSCRGLLTPLKSSNNLRIVSNAWRKAPLVSSLSGTKLNS